MVLLTCVLKDRRVHILPSSLDRSRAGYILPSQDDRNSLGTAGPPLALSPPHAVGPGHPYRSRPAFGGTALPACLAAWLCELASSSGTEVGLEPLLTCFCWLCFAQLVPGIPLKTLWNECSTFVLISCVALDKSLNLSLPQFPPLKMEILSHTIVGLEVLKGYCV